MVYPSYVDNRFRILEYDESEGVIKEKKKKNPMMFTVSSTDDLQKSRGSRSKWVAFIDVEGRKTISLKTGKALDIKQKVKIDNLSFKAFWEARTAIKRDYLLLGITCLSGAFIPFLLKWVASMFGKVVPW